MDILEKRVGNIEKRLDSIEKKFQILAKAVVDNEESTIQSFEIAREAIANVAMELAKEFSTEIAAIKASTQSQHTL